MITSRKNAIEWFDSLNVAYWYLYPGKDTNSGNWIRKSSDSEAATPADAIRELEQTFQWLDSGAFTLVATDTAKNTPKGKYMMQVNFSRLENANAGYNNNQATVVQGIPESDVEKRIAAAVQAAMDKIEMQRLKEELSELRKENKELNDSNGFTRLAGIAADLLPTVLPHIMGGKVPLAQVAGLNAVPQTTLPMDNETVETIEAENLTAEEMQRLGNIVETLSQIDPTGWLNKLETLTAAIKKNPALLDMALKFC